MIIDLIRWVKFQGLSALCVVDTVGSLIII